MRAIAAFAPINRAGEGAEERLLTSLDDAHSAVRVEAVVSLGSGERGARGELSPAGTERVVRLLEDENVLVRLHALDALGAAGSSQRVEAIAAVIGRAVLGSEIPERLKALEVLGRIDSDEAEAMLVERLDDDDERVVRVAAAGLTNRRPQELEEWVLASLADGQLAEDFLMDTLAEIASDRSRPTAISMLDHPDQRVRSQCAAILEQIGDRASFDALVAVLHGMVPAVEATLALPSTDLGSEGVEFFEMVGRIGRVGEQLDVYSFDEMGLRKLLHSEKLHDQLVAMSRLAEEDSYDVPILGSSDGDSDLGEQVQAIAAEQSPILRAIAYDVLGKSARPEAGAPLARGIFDPVFQVRFRALEALVHYTSTTGQRSPLHSVYERRHEFEPTTFATDDPNLLMRERLEQAIRDFEPSWTSVGMAEAELASGTDVTSGLLAAEFLAPREEGMAALLEALATGADGVSAFALRAIEGRAGRGHVEKLRAILAAETAPDRQQALAEIIAEASE